MASPPHTKSTPASPPAQESPFSSYVSSLSPINPVSGQNNVLADLTVPSPQPVFTSPHINFPRKGNPLRRFQKLGFSGAEKFPLFAIDDAICSENSYISGSSLLRSANQLSSCTQECNRFGASQDHSSSNPSTCVDKFLADPMQVCDKHAEGSQVIQGDCTNCNEDKRDGKKEKLPYPQPSHQSCSVSKSTDSSVDDPEMKVTSDLPQVSYNNSTGTKEITTETHAPDVNKGKRVDAHVNLASSHLAEGDLISERSSIDANLTDNDKQLKTVVNTIYGEISPELPMVNMSALCGGPMSMDLTATNCIPFMPGKKDCVIADYGRKNPVSSAICHHRIKDAHAKMHVAQGCNCTQLQSEALPNEYDNHQDLSAGKPCPPAYSEILNDQEEVAQHQRVMRKRLQFEGVENHNMTDGEANSLNFKNEGYKSEAPGTIMDFHSVSHAESVAPCSNEQLNQLVNQSGNALCKLSLSSCRTSKSHSEALGKSTNVKGNSSMKVPTPSGIGLHLNTIGSAAKRTVNMLCEEEDLEALVGTSDSDGHCKTLADSNNSFSSRSTTPHPSAKPWPCLNNSRVSATGNDQSQLLDNHDAKLPNSSSIHQSSLDAEPLNSSLQMKLIDRCMTPCTTKKSPSEDASRTHLSPKKKRKKLPENEGCKRCTCKRSKCLKLYCDCFAAGTFCSEDCACQECFNRAEYKEMVQETRQHIESRNPLAFAPKVVLHITEAPKDTGDFKNITPTSARHKRGCNCKKSQCLKKYCECYQAGVGCSLGCRCEGCKNTFGMKGSGEISDMGFKFLQEIKDKQLAEGDCESDSSCEKSRVEAKRETIIAKQGLACLSPLTPFQGSDKNDIPESQIPVSYYQSPESGPSALLSYTVSPSCPWGSISNKSYYKAREEEEVPALGHRLEPFSAAKSDPFSPRWDGFPDICDFSPLSNLSPPAGGGSFEARTRERKILQMKLFEGSGHLSAGLLWRSSPVTPLPKFGASKPVKEPDSDSGLHYTTEDDTPDVLKDNDSPVKTVTASSPNQKRVSPPSKCLRESGPSSSPAMKGGRKFILKSVPSFPSLTP